MLDVVWLIPALPLAGFLIILLFCFVLYNWMQRVGAGGLESLRGTAGETGGETGGLHG